MPYNVPEEEKPAFNKQTQKGLELLTQGVSDTLSRVQSLQQQTLVDAYNQPVQAPVTRDLTPLEQYVYEPQPVQEVADLAVPPTRESMVAPQEQPQVLSNFRNQANAQFGGDMVSITPEQQASTDVIGAEIDSLRNDAGEIASSPLEVFSKPLDANKVKALGFVDSDGNVTETGELFFNLKESGVFNEDGTINEKGQAYLIPRSEIVKPENVKAFKTWYDDNLDYQESTGGEMIDAVVGFGKNIIGGLYDSYKLSKKLTSLSGLADVARQTVSGKETVAELQVDQIGALEQVAKNFQAVGGYADILQGLAGRALYEGAAAATGVPMQDMKDAAEENLYLARQRQLAAKENLRDLEVGEIAEAVYGLDGAKRIADEAKATLGEDRFNQRYAGTAAVVELTGDPANLMPAAKAFKVATSAPIASRAIIKAQQILGKTAQIEKALNEAQTIVEAGNTILKKEAVTVPLAQKLFTDISARAGANPELIARSQQAMDVAQRITASADEVRAAMPSAIASVEQLAAKRASLATRIPEEYAKKVIQTAELGAKVRAMPASVIGSILEGTGETISKIDNAVTGYLSERGMDQAYNAALGAAGVVGLAGNPIVGAIGAGAAALKTGKFLTEYGKIFKYVGREMKNARGQIPFWKRVAYHTAPKSLGQGLSHTFNIFELGGATSDILRRTGRGIVAAYPSDLFFEYLSDGGEMRPQTMTRAAAESLVLGGAFAAGGGAFMGTKQRMRELAIGDEINFRQGLVDTNQKARFEALPPVIKRSIATYSMANPTLNYNFIESGGSEYDPNSNTANINIYSTNPLKALVAHETLHHTIIKNNMEGGIAAMFLGDTKTNSVGGFFRSRDGKLDPEFEAFANKYYDRMRASGMSDAEIKTTYPLEKAAVEYFIEQHSDQYADMAESGELGAIAARGEVRKKLGSILETILPKIPVLRDLHFKSGGAIDANGAFVTGVGILGDFGVSQNPIAKKMFREMNKRSSGMMPGQFEPLFSDKEGSGAPLFFDPANEIDVEMMHPMIQVDANDKPILKDGRPIALSKEVDMNRAIAGLSIIEAYRKLREGNYAPEKGEAYVDDDGEFQPGWVSDRVLTQMFAKHPFNNEQKRMIRQTNKMVREGTGQRMVMINFPSTTRNKAGKVVYKTQGATIRDTVPVAVTISKDGNILYGLMSVTKLQENIKKRAQSRRGKKLYSGNIDMILRDVQAMMDFHKKGEDSINWFAEKYGIVEADQRKKFINTMFGLLNKKEQAVLNPMLLEDGVKSSDNVYRTYRADRVSKAIPMSPDEYAAMPFSYEAVSQVRMPEQRQMPEVSPEELNPVANKQEAQGLWADGKRMFALNEMDEKLTPITSKAMLDSYSADAIGWMEPDTEPTGQMRFMPEKIDADYMKAVESGDVEAQQRIVDEAAKMAGYDVGPVWHGSSAMNYNNRGEGLPFTVFDEEKRELGFHFGTEEQARERANIPSGMKNMFRGYLKGPFGATVDYFQFDHNMESQVLLAANQSFDKLKNESGEIDKLTQSREYGADIKTKQKRHKILSGLVKGFPSDVLPERDDNIKERNQLNDKKISALKKHIGKDQEKARELIKGMGFEGLAYPNRAEGNKPALSYLVFDPSQIKSADPITRDDSGNIIPPSNRFDITSNDLRFMPEPANPAAPNVPFKKPLSRTDAIPDIDSTLISDAVDINGFAFDRPAKVYMQHPNGEKTYFNYDPAYLIKPEFKDLRAALAGKNIVILEADKMRATGGDMGGVLHPFLRSNQVAVKGDDGKMYKAIWANMNSGFVTRTKNRWFKDNATYAVIHLMDDIAHSSNKRVARIVDEAWTKANLSDYEQRIVAVAMQSAITAEQKAGYNVKITQAKNRIKSGRLSPDKIALENKAIEDWLNERNALSWTGIDQEIAKKITQLKSAQTRLQNKTGNQAGLDKAKQSLRDYLDADPAHAAAFDAISKKGASLKISDNIGNTFKSRGAAIQGILGLAFDKFNPSDLLKKTEDFQGSENMDLVAAVQLSKNKDIFAVYFGNDPKEEAAMSASERKVRDKLRADPSFVEHEAFDWMMLGPKNADNFLAESSLKPEELIPAYRNQHPKTSVKNGSAETVLGAMKMFAGIPLTVAKKTKISNAKSTKKALAEQVLTLQNVKRTK